MDGTEFAAKELKDALEGCAKCVRLYMRVCVCVVTHWRAAQSVCACICVVCVL